MKILLATESYWPNHDGGAIFERFLVHGLIDRGHEVLVIAPSTKGKAFKEKDGDSTIYRIRAWQPLPKFRRLGVYFTVRPDHEMRKIISKFQPDVIHAHNPFGIGGAALRIAEKLGIPYISTNHTQPEHFVQDIPLLKYVPHVSELWWRWQIKFLNRSRVVISPSHTATDLLLSHGLAAPSGTISNGIDLDRFNPKHDPKAVIKKYHLPKKPLVLYTGRVNHEKRVDLMIKAIPEVRKSIDAHFVVGGKGTEVENLKRLAVRKGVERHVTFTGFIPDDELPLIYTACTLFCIASPEELQSIVTLEAMASGLPVVAADQMALPELCHSGRNGYLFLPGDVHGLAQAITRILQNPTMGRKMGAESRRIVEKDHAMPATVRKYEEVYQSVL